MSALPSFSLSWKGKRGSPGRGVVPPLPCPLYRQYPRRSPRLKRRLRAFLMRCALLYRTTLRRSEVIAIQWYVGADILCFGRMHKLCYMHPLSDPLKSILPCAPVGARHLVHILYNVHEPGMTIQSNTSHIHTNPPHITDRTPHTESSTIVTRRWHTALFLERPGAVVG